jgi:hypothetical protein
VRGKVLKGTGFSPYINYPSLGWLKQAAEKFSYDFSREGYGLQPVHQTTEHRRALAPEGISSASFSSPQRLKPIHIDCQTYGLKAVPFKN